MTGRVDNDRYAQRRGLKLRLSALREAVRGSLWAVPAAMVVAAILVAAALVPLEPSLSNDGLFGIFIPASADGARATVQIVAGSVVTVTSVVFSLTVVALQISASNYSPRVLRSFLRDRGTQSVLGIFLATFAYSFVVLHNIRSTGSSGATWAPQVALALLPVFAFASLGALVFFIHHVTQSIRVETILRDVLKETLETTRSVYGEQAGHSYVCKPLHELLPHDRVEVRGRRSGFIQTIDAEALLPLLEERDIHAALAPVVGDHLVAGTTLGWVWRRAGDGSRLVDDDLTEAFDNSVYFGTERTMQQDVAFGLRQLVDVAVRALSPGVNDPNTAVAVISHLGVVYGELAQQHLGHGVFSDEDGVERLMIPGLNLDEYLYIAVQQISHYARSDVMVLTRLLRMLADVKHLASSHNAPHVDPHIHRVAEEGHRSLALEGEVEALDLARRDALQGRWTMEHATRRG
jgi:uncharacterized membrane protein